MALILDKSIYACWTETGHCYGSLYYYQGYVQYIVASVNCSEQASLFHTGPRIQGCVSHFRAALTRDYSATPYGSESRTIYSTIHQDHSHNAPVN